MTADSAVIVIAKAPLPGAAKTRLSPPCTPAEAAALAEAALLDTLDAVEACSAPRRVLAFDGDPGPWARPGMTVVAQQGDGLGERLARAFADAGTPAVLVGMDTPQITPAILDRALATLTHDDHDAVLGPAGDGGYWAIGFNRPQPTAFQGVPMSTPETGDAQLARLRALGLRVALLETLCDVDTITDAVAVARRAPSTRFARALEAVPGVVAIEEDAP